MTPKDFLVIPAGSIFASAEVELVAFWIMRILARNGNTWRLLQWEEYKEERENAGEFQFAEAPYFNKAVAYSQSEITAKMLSPVWGGTNETAT